MDCTAVRKKIQEAKTFVEVEDSLKEAKFGRSQVELVRVGMQIKEAQPKLATHLFETAIKEMEDHTKPDPNKPEQEYTGGTSDQASDRADPLQRKDKPTPDGGQPDTAATGTEDQMKEDVMGMGLHPDIANGMMGKMNMPQLNLPQQIKQMQYTVKRAIGPVFKEIEKLKLENKQLREANTALDKQVREISTTHARSMTLDIRPSGRGSVQEAVSFPLPVPGASTKSLEDRRNEMYELNKMLNETDVQPSDIYQ